MSNTPIWSRIDGPNGPSITVIFSTGETSIVSASHASQNEVLLALVNGDSEESIRELINPVNTIAKRLRRLSANITTNGTDLFLDGSPLDNSLSKYIMRLIHEENTNPEAPSWEPFVNFLEKVSQNNSAESRESLFDFITLHGLTIQANGNFIGYKGVNSELLSKRHGPGIVNNVAFKDAQLNNSPGNIVEIDRNYVESNRDLACAQGLHVTTRAYASGWGERVVVVSVNPRDVVAVPRGEVQKMRVCRYEVLEETTREIPEWATGDNVAESTPLFWDDKPRKANVISDEDAAKLKESATQGTRLTVTYHGKEYSNVFVTSLDEAHVKISGETLGYRTFFLNEIDSVEEVAAQESSEITALRKELEELRATEEKINLEYHGSTFTEALVHRVGATHVTIKTAKGYHRTLLFLNGVNSVVKSSVPEEVSEIRTQLEEAIASGEPVTVTYRGHRFENVLVRRLDGALVKVQVSDTGDAGYRTFALASIDLVEPVSEIASVELSGEEKLIQERFLKAVENGEDVVFRDSLGRFLSATPVKTSSENGVLHLGVKLPANNNEFEWLVASEWSIHLGGLS